MERVDNEKKYNKYNNYKKNKKYEAPIVEEEVTAKEDVIVEDVTNETVEVEEKIEVITEIVEPVVISEKKEVKVVSKPKRRKSSTVKKIFS